jgi:hypothetical protein
MQCVFASLRLTSLRLCARESSFFSFVSRIRRPRRAPHRHVASHSTTSSTSRSTINSLKSPQRACASISDPQTDARDRSRLRRTDVDRVTLNSKNSSLHTRDGKLHINFLKPQVRQSFAVRRRYHGKPKDGLILTKDKDGKPSAVGDNWPNRVHHWIPHRSSIGKSNRHLQHHRAGETGSGCERQAWTTSKQLRRSTHLDLLGRCADSAVLHDHRRGPVCEVEPTSGR